jgi:hypothetical protein
MLAVKLTITVLAAILMIGCGTTQTIKSKDSEALRVANAAGLGGKLKDTVLPKDTVTSLIDSPGFAMAYSASGYSSPLPGLSGGQTAGLHLVSWLFSPEAPAARNSIFGWMEATSGDENNAIKKLMDTLLENGKAVALEMGYEVNIVRSTNGTGGGVQFISEAGVCNTKGNCTLAFGVRDPQRVKGSKIPEFIENKNESWFFNPGKRNHSFYLFSKNWEGINQLEVLTKLSQNMPEWFYLYVAPKKVKFNMNEEVKVPLVINQGKLHYFVKSDG